MHVLGAICIKLKILNKFYCTLQMQVNTCTVI